MAMVTKLVASTAFLISFCSSSAKRSAMLAGRRRNVHVAQHARGETAAKISALQCGRETAALQVCAAGR